jgi:hypothetical protein
VSAAAAVACRTERSDEDLLSASVKAPSSCCSGVLGDEGDPDNACPFFEIGFRDDLRGERALDELLESL